MDYKLNITNLALRPRLTHTHKCRFWNEEKDKDCDCGYDTFSINEHLKKDLESLFNMSIRKLCPFCLVGWNVKPTKAVDGFYHKVSADGKEFSDYCENSSFFFLMDEL